MRISRYYILFLTGIAVFLTSTAYLSRDNDESGTNAGPHAVYDNSRRIKFDHKFHVKEAGIKCEDCHKQAAGSVSAKDNLNPKKEYCADCHDVKNEKDCAMCHYEKKRNLKQTNRHIYFSHKVHVLGEKKQCLDCHAGLDEVKFSKESPGAFPNMQACYTCHGSDKAPGNCEACHMNLTNLIPTDHRKSNFLNEHRADFNKLSGSTECMMCHSDNFCQVCHSPSRYTGENTKDNFYIPYYTKEGATRLDRSELQKLNKAHTLNYRFTHGLDANHKGFECKTCHEPATFCSSCHQNGGEIITGIAPSSHLQPDFTTLGVNTGGGLHSKLAKKDIESCQSCHGTEGSDPVCVRCHVDNDGVKGTNPRTHDFGFTNEEKGIWHDTEGAVCYTCHTDPNARPGGIRGVGFCGYCHGK